MALLRSIQAFLGLREEEDADAQADAQADADVNADASERRGTSREVALVRVFEGILQKLEIIDHRLEGVTRAEQAVSGMSGMSGT